VDRFEMINFQQQNADEWRIEAPRVEQHGRVSRVRCRVDGEDVWFESADAELTPRIEAFAGAMLIAALKCRARLIVEEPVDHAWLEGQRRIFTIYRKWWYPDREFPIVAEVRDEPASKGAPFTATCFTGGVDSFHTLLSNLKRIDALYFVHGYDIPLDDDVRMQAFAASIHEVAGALGKKSLVLKSNLRGHHRFAASDWTQSHGAAIVAGAHLLSGAIGRLIIPSSYNMLMDVPWGSHWKTDRLHSRPEIVFEHFGQTHYRYKKIKEVAHHPLFLRHVRVCWANQSPAGNCSQCEKCLRTMTVMENLGVLSRSEAFDQSRTLIERLDALPMIMRPSMNRPWATTLSQCKSPELHNAVARLLQRSFPGVPFDYPPFHKMPGLRLQSMWNQWRAG